MAFSTSTLLRDLRAIWHFDNRIALLLEKTVLQGSGGNLSIYRKQDMEIIMDKAAGDQSGARYAITSGMYRQFLPIILQKAAGNHLVIMDLGANVGGFTLMLALEKIPLQKVIAVELNPNTYLRLRLNLERNLRIMPDNLHCINAGVCGSNRSIALTLGQGGMDDNIFGAKKNVSGGQAYTIAGRTFDSIYEQCCASNSDSPLYVDICKIDIEGAEYEIILGNQATHLKHCRFLLMEIHPHSDYSEKQLLDQLQNLGFQKILSDELDVSENVVLFQNTQIS
ncbi:MAG: FkbM family methyltransferase [Candidatus Kapabacteria bacterium]|nr:FkbM family methyltransferase [Candidatus Kapabacteria bacterium]